MDSYTNLVGWDRLQLPERVNLRRGCAIAHRTVADTQLALCGAVLQVVTPQLDWFDIPSVHRCRECSRVRMAA
ncbi:hypothetical protein [Fodinicola acaciae]|uniref:hypothetical protein n=1 Tax=Fodinicola acaciae TaxID=2681555 RepID=UPI0013D60F9A|nr:hypothetical protein [Fodinicola acaciae]